MKFSIKPLSVMVVTVTAIAASAHGQAINLDKLQNQTKARPELLGNSLIMIPSGKANPAKEEANKLLVLAWHDDFWNKGNFDSWPKYMTADFRNHDPAEPTVGAQALVDWLEARLKASGRGKPAPKPIQTKLFVIAEGDLVFISGGQPNTDPNVDPARTFGGNVIRIENNKIVEWWYTGAIVGSPGDPNASGMNSGTSAP